MSRGLVMFLFFTLVFCFAIASVSQAEVKEGMTQGEFALWLVKEIGALSKLPPSALGQDAIDFLTNLGVAPENGWKKDEALTANILKSILGGGDDTKGLSFNDLVTRVRDYVRTQLSDRSLGVFRATGSGSGSTATT